MSWPPVYWATTAAWIPGPGRAVDALEPRTIRTERMTLRPIEEGDRARYVKMYTEGEAFYRPWMPSREEQGLSVEGLFERQLVRTREGWAQGTGARFVGVLEDGTIAGAFNLNNIARGIFQNADAGWMVNFELAGQGYATEGVRALLAYAFEARPRGAGLHRVQAGIIPINTPSLRVAEKAGFRREGLAVRYLRINGMWQDHVIFARTVEEEVKGK